VQLAARRTANIALVAEVGAGPHGVSDVQLRSPSRGVLLRSLSEESTAQQMLMEDPCQRADRKLRERDGLTKVVEVLQRPSRATCVGSENCGR